MFEVLLVVEWKFLLFCCFGVVLWIYLKKKKKFRVLCAAQYWDLSIYMLLRSWLRKWFLAVLLGIRCISKLAADITNLKERRQKNDINLFLTRKNIQDLNWQRKNMQLTAGAKLREMESTWVSLVSKNYEIERTIVQLENEISQIKQQHGEANKENIQQDFQ
uniref:Pre-mRNA-splicing factor SPF27 n=1 Tax=Bubo bubo TaxID=30461 RepID=A0A8C0F8W7_BUBBB